ncbi:MAG: 3-deoxy-manno-octulosonate cytidylyltransferase [Methylohalobius crimeensis]
MTSFKVVIPARYASSRLPGKPLLELAGRPMIAHVCEQALQAGAEAVVVATDDERIGAAAETAGVTAILTDAAHASGTERIQEVVRRMGWREDEIVVNWQGDEPLLAPELVHHLAESLAGHPRAAMATLATPATAEEVFSPHAVKVVMDHDGCALYFSRAPIPWCRDGFAQSPPRVPDESHWRHIGVYAYRAGLLHRYVNWSPAPLEKVEALEQLRVLWHGERIFVVTVSHAPEAGVDTPADISRVADRLRERETENANRGAR